MKIVCTVKTEADALRASLLAKIINDDPKFAGIVVIVKQEDEARLPRINVGTIGHINHGRIGLNLAIIEVLNRGHFDFPETKLSFLKPQQISAYQLPKLRQQHTARARQEIKRYSLNPRVMKKQRGRRFR